MRPRLVEFGSGASRCKTTARRKFFWVSSNSGLPSPSMSAAPSHGWASSRAPPGGATSSSSKSLPGDLAQDLDLLVGHQDHQVGQAVLVGVVKGQGGRVGFEVLAQLLGPGLAVGGARDQQAPDFLVALGSPARQSRRGRAWRRPGVCRRPGRAACRRAESGSGTAAAVSRPGG